MLEIELKFQIKSEEIKKIIKLLKQVGFSVTEKRTYEKTVMYDNLQQIMQITDGRIRLRASGKKYKLSYKKPITRKGIKKEIEYEVVVSDFTTAEKILEMMEFKPMTSYERYRTTLERNHIEVTIDEYPFASFIEIEGEEKEIMELAALLGFLPENNLTESCDTLFQRWRKEKGLSFKPHMLFKDYDK
jgi:adenylate cyclase class 2